MNYVGNKRLNLPKGRLATKHYPQKYNVKYE